MAGEGKTVLVAVDASDESMYCLSWALDHLLTKESGFKIVLATVKPVPVSVLRFSGPGTADVFPLIEADLKKESLGALEKAKNLCESRSVTNYETLLVEGDARHALCEAVTQHHAEMLVMGSHGYGAFKRAILGSVSDYCAHHAHCSVLIVKKPKAKADN